MPGLGRGGIMPGFGRGPPAPAGPPGRGPAGRGGIWDWPDGAPLGRGADGRAGAWPPPTPNGLFATRWPPGRGAPGRGAGLGAAGRTVLGASAAGATAAGATGAAGVTGAGTAATGGATGGADTAGAASATGRGAGLGADATFLAGASVATGNASRSRRATGASTVEDALLTNSPSSLSFARTSLLGTPSSFASSCTRALPATGLLCHRTGGSPHGPELGGKRNHGWRFIGCS